MMSCWKCSAQFVQPKRQPLGMSAYPACPRCETAIDAPEDWSFRNTASATPGWEDIERAHARLFEIMYRAGDRFRVARDEELRKHEEELRIHTERFA